MAFDPKSGRLLIGSRNPGKLFVMDANDGSVIQTLGIVNICDDMTFDPQHRRLYVTGAEGLDVVKQAGPDNYVIEQHVDTFAGKTSIYIPSLNRFYVVHTKGPQAKKRQETPGQFLLRRRFLHRRVSDKSRSRLQSGSPNRSNLPV
ncbi:hypothetical protein OKW41_004480 [Paraburkholderia sp. UCT70]|uniref:YncE family protein n=1 Tax=Paraburkholderia sp. UCT70 TaxID=2991068 RepID=UPI003D1D638D